MDCSTLLRLVVRLCSCSPAKEAEYFTTQRYSLPCTSSFSAAARTPGCSLLHGSSCSTARSRNWAGAWFHGKAEIHPTPGLLQLHGVGQSRRAFVQNQCDRVTRNLVLIQH